MRAWQLALALCLVPGLAGAQAGSDQAAERLGIRSEEPMEIRADELEAIPGGSGQDRVIFQSNVRVEQGQMVLHSDWLEAIYPKREDSSEAGGPERITARGNVRIVQADSEARCSEAVFVDQTCQAECTTKGGKATLHRRDDVIEADRIVFDLCKGVLKGKGGVRIRTRGSQADR